MPDLRMCDLRISDLGMFTYRLKLKNFWQALTNGEMASVDTGYGDK